MLALESDTLPAAPKFLHADQDVRFMWVRAQVDYLQRLPNDVEKRKALKHLPPDLPRTYIRIFETIDSSYSVQTATYIRRALKWLAFADEVARNNHLGTSITHDSEYSFTYDTLCQVICIENEHDWPPVEAVPTNLQLRRWCGCLVRDTGRIIELSHFTVKEFLKLNADSVPDYRVRKYLVAPGDGECITLCLRYMNHEHFRQIRLSMHSTALEVNDFLDENPVYRFLTRNFCYILDRSTCCGMREELDYLLQRFFTVTPSPFLQLWAICNALFVGFEHELCLSRDFHTPLQVASYAGLFDQVTTLLNIGADPNLKNSSTKLGLLPLPLSICNCHFDTTFAWNAVINLGLEGSDDVQCNTPKRPQERSLQVARALLESGANVDGQLSVKLETDDEEFIVTPLVLAVLCCNREVASLLLSKGANWNAKAETDAGNSIDLCSIKGLLDSIPEHENTVRHIATLSGNCDLQEVLDKWIKSKDLNSLGSQSSDVPEDDLIKPQDLFVNAYRTGDWQTVREYLHESTRIDINCIDDEGSNAIIYASKGSKDVLLYLLEHGADPNVVLPNGNSALRVAVRDDCIENIRLLLKYGAHVDYKTKYGYTPFLHAVRHKRYEAMRILRDAGANINACYDDGSNALLFNSSNEDEGLWSLLLDAGINPNIPNNYGTRTLHLACRLGHHSKVKKLIDSYNEAPHTVNQNSLELGYPLYIAARKGFCQIVELLLDSGAIIDKVGEGNLLGSALMAACAKGHRDVVRLLLSRGAALEVEGSRFLSAAETARAFRKTAILEILEEYTNSKEADKHKHQVEEAQDDVSEVVQSDHSNDKEQQEGASSTASFSEEDDIFYETEEPAKTWTDTVIHPEPHEASRQDA